MASAKKAVPAARRRKPAGDAITILTDDHQRVKALFKKFEKLQDGGSAAEKSALVREVCTELKVHTRIEEEIFYPAVRAALDEDDLLDEAEVEHASAKDLIEQLEAMTPKDHLYDAKVTVLGEYVDHHVKEEEKEMFPKVKKAKSLDTAALGAEMAARRPDLQAELATARKRPATGRTMVSAGARR